MAYGVLNGANEQTLFKMYKAVPEQLEFYTRVVMQVPLNGTDTSL